MRPACYDGCFRAITSPGSSAASSHWRRRRSRRRELTLRTALPRIARMAQSLVASAGWTVSHWFYRIDRARWRALDATTRAAAIDEARAWMRGALAEEGLQLVPFGLVGKGDFGVMAIHPDLVRHQQLGQEIAATALGTCLTPLFSFLSLSE